MDSFLFNFEISCLSSVTVLQSCKFLQVRVSLQCAAWRGLVSRTWRTYKSITFARSDLSPIARTYVNLNTRLHCYARTNQLRRGFLLYQTTYIPLLICSAYVWPTQFAPAERTVNKHRQLSYFRRLLKQHLKQSPIVPNIRQGASAAAGACLAAIDTQQLRSIIHKLLQ